MPERNHRGRSPRASRLRGPRASRPVADLTVPLEPGLCYGSGGIAEIHDETGLAHLFRHLQIQPSRPTGRLFGEGSAAPTPVLVKVTWHVYAPGNTDPVALDRLLGALPGQAVLLEGHITRPAAISEARHGTG